MFDLRLEYIVTWINSKKYSSVALQFPDGLKRRATEVVDFFSEKTDASFIILGDPCYGACDVFHNFRTIADALVHFGHSPIPCQGIEEDVLYVEVFCNVDIKDIIRNNVQFFLPKVGLLATVQYIKCLDQAKEVIEESGKSAVIVAGDARICYPGQVLGCDCSSAEAITSDVDMFLFIGEGDFHPLSVAFSIKKKICVLNPITGDFKSIDIIKDRILRIRFAAIQRAKEAKSFLVIVCSKIGQKRELVADDIIAKLQKSKKKAYKVYMSELTPQNLMAYSVDAFVNTACPRLAMDDSSRYSKPILTPPEAEIVLGIREWEDYVFDAIRP